MAEDAQLQLTLVSFYLLEDEGLAVMMLFVLVISHHPQVFFLSLFAKTYTKCISVETAVETGGVLAVGTSSHDAVRGGDFPSSTGIYCLLLFAKLLILIAFL